MRSAKLLAATNTAPVYLYQFNYKAVYHLIDLDYVFYFDKTHPIFDINGDDGQFVYKFTTLWTNFVETG